MKLETTGWAVAADSRLSATGRLLREAVPDSTVVPHREFTAAREATTTDVDDRHEVIVAHATYRLPRGLA